MHSEDRRGAGSVGSPNAEFLPKEGTALGVQIEIVPDMLSLRYPMEVNLVGDSAQILRALLPSLDRKTERSWRGHAERAIITSDSGSRANWHARDLELGRVLKIRANPEVPPLPPYIPDAGEAPRIDMVHGDPQEGSATVGAAEALLISILRGCGK